MSHMPTRDLGVSELGQYHNRDSPETVRTATWMFVNPGPGGHKGNVKRKRSQTIIMFSVNTVLVCLVICLCPFFPFF